MSLVFCLRFGVILIAALSGIVTAQTTLAPLVNGCQPKCQLNSDASHWQWQPVTITGSVVYATIIHITNDNDGSVRTTTIYNELPKGLKPPPTNKAGTQTKSVTIETARGKFTTFAL